MLLHFEAVDYVCDLWVNGVHLCAHEGGQTGFTVDITEVLDPGREQSIVVRAQDSCSLEQPRGKQDWEPNPHVIWYRRTTGIWRSVWAEVVDETHIQSIAWTPGAIPGEVSFDLRMAHVTEASALDVELTFELPGGSAVTHRCAVQGDRSVGTVHLLDPRFTTEPERLLWSPESPTLIDVQIKVCSGQVVHDTVASYIGLRSVGTDRRNFLLNGSPYYLRLVLEQAFWPDSHLSSPSDDALRKEAELIKALGFNGLRMHQVTADPRFLYWCDRIGLVVWIDAAAAYRFSDHALSRTVSEWMKIVHRDRSHPSIVAWVAFNESWGVPDVATDQSQQHAVSAMYHLLKALDASRLVIGNDGWEYVAGDILGIHDYSQDPAVLRQRYGAPSATDATIDHTRPGGRVILANGVSNPGVPVVISEFGGTTLSGQDSWEGYGAVTDRSDLLERLKSLVSTVSSSDVAGFCYTQLTDTLQEMNGLLTEDRIPKIEVSEVNSLILGP